MFNSIRKLIAWIMALLLMSSVLTPSVVWAETDSNTSTEKVSIGNVSLNGTFVSGGTKQGDDELYVWNANSSASGHSFMFNVNMNVNYITGQNSGTIPTGIIKVSVPLHILKNKSGNYADKIELPFDEIKDKNGDGTISKDEIPDDLIETAKKSSDELNYFAYYVNEKTNQAIVMNIVDLKQSINDVFDVKYDTTETTFNYYDYDHKGSVSDAFYAGLMVDGNAVDKTNLHDESSYQVSGEKTFDAVTKSFKVAMNTSAKITNVLKGNPTLYKTWNTSWGVEPEKNGLNYYYLIWEIRTRIDDPTQSYHFLLNDTMTVNDDSAIIGFRLAGNSQYQIVTSAKTAEITDTDKNGKAKELQGDGYRYDYVLTRHLTSSFTTGYKVKNKITATIDPVDDVDQSTSADSTREYVYEAPEYSGERGSAYVEKYGGEHGANRSGIRSDYYNLADLQTGEATDYIDGLAYNIHANALPYQWTTADGQSSTDHTAYGQRNVTYEITDDHLWLYKKADEKFTSQSYSDSAANSLASYKLDPADYDFASLTYKLDTSDAEWNEDEQKFTKVKRSLDESDAITWYVKVNGNWLKAVTYNFVNGEVKSDDATGREYIRSINSSSITFNAGVDGIKAEVTNKLYNSTIDINPSIRLFDTDHVKTVANSLGTSDSYLILKNKATFRLIDESGKECFTQSRVDGNRIRDAQRSSDLHKRLQSSSNDVRNKTFTLSWKVTQDEIMNTDGGTQYISQNGGTFYDLLPEGATLQKDSIVIQSKADPTNNSDAYTIDESMYSVETKINYKGSGRTLVTIHVNGSYPCFIVNYSTLHSWEDIRLYGTSIRNPVAYETGNEDIAGGFGDDGGRLSSTNKTLLQDLDPATEAKRFIYSEDTTDIAVVTAALAGLDKKVMASDDEKWMRNTVVSPSSDYAYRLRYSNVKEESMKHIVLYDRLEQYDKSETEKGKWRGILSQVDVRQITQTYKDADPVIYVSMKSNIDLGESSENALDPRSKDAKAIDDETSDVWMTLTDYEKKYGTLGTNTDAIPTAVAVKLADDFTLKTNQIISATLYMKSPHHVNDDGSNTYPETYNDAYIYGVRGEDDNKEASYLNQGYTSVKYHITGRMTIHKVSADNEDTVIPGISFRVKGTSDYGTKTDTTKQTNAHGDVTFRELEKGKYTLQEVEGNEDYLEDHTEYNVKVDENGNIKVWKMVESEPEDSLNGSYTIENTPRVHTDIEFSKRSLKDDTLINGAYFKLSGTSYYKNDISMTSATAGGRVTFSNVERGTYKLEEYKTPDDFIKPDSSWNVTVDENGVFTITGDDVKSENGAYTLYNEPYHAFSIWKQSSKDGSSLANAQFTLKGEGENVVETSSGTGYANFNHLKAGTYILQETKASDGYRLDSTSRTVTITRKGEVTIEGLTKEENSDNTFIVKNTPIPAGTVVVTKKWVDDEPTSEHPIPKIHLKQIKDESTNHSLVQSTTTSAKSSMRTSSTTQKKASINNFATSKLLASALDAQTEEEGPFTPTNNTSGTVQWQLYKKGSDYIVEFSPTTGNEIGQFKGGRDSNKKSYSSMWRNSTYNGKTLAKLVTEVRFKGTITSTMYQDFFRYCGKLKKIDFTGFDTSKSNSSTEFWNMFGSCSNLTSVDVSNWDMSNVTDFQELFRGSSVRNIIGINKWNVSKVDKFGRMFAGCNLDTLDISNWNFASVSNFAGIFDQSPKINKLIMKNCQLNNFTSLDKAFYNISGSLKEIDLSGVDAPKLANVNSLFNGYTHLEKANLSGMKTPKINDTDQLFNGCTNLKEVNLNGMDTSNVGSFSNLFKGCLSLTSANVNQLDVSKATNFSNAFSGCSSLTELNLSHWKTDSGTNIGNTFNGCTSLQVLQIQNLNTKKGTNSQGTFSGDSQLRAVRLGNNFVFGSNENEIWLPNAGNGNTSKYSGQWSYGSERQTVGYTVAEVKDIFNNSNNTSYSSRAGWWYWQLSTEELNKPEEYDSIDNNWLDKDPNKDYSIADTDGNAGYWQKIDDETWTYTFYVYNQDAKWQVSEVEDDKISYDSSSTTATYIADPSNNSITLSSNKDSEVLTNTAKAIATRKYGSLSLTKDVTKKDPNVDIPDGDTFKFDVTLTNEDHPSLLKGIHEFTATLIKGNATETRSVIFTDGRATVELQKDQTLTINGLVSGTTYSVKEEDHDDYELGSIVNDAKIQTGEASGTISESTSSVSFTNIYLKEAPKTVDLTLTKKITGDETQLLDSGNPFEIQLSGLTPDQTYTFRDGMNVTADAYGKATISNLKLQKDQSITLSHVPVGTQYQVKELGGKTYTASYEVTNSAADGAIAATHGENTEVNKDLNTAVETADENENITVTFTNHLEAEVKTRKLKLVKVVSGADNDTNSYEFMISYKGLKPGTIIHSTRSHLTADASGEANVTYYLKKDESVTFEDVPEGAKYNITEAANIMTPSYKIINLDKQRVDVKDTDTITKTETGKENTALSTSDSEEMNTMPDDNVNVTFTNTAPLTGGLAIKKIVIGNMGNRQKLFRFKITLTKEAGDDVKAVNGTFPAVLTNGSTKVGNMDVQFSKGEAEVYLSHDQTLSLSNIPVNVNYRVEEVDYLEAGYNLVEIDQAKVSASDQMTRTTLSGNETTLSEAYKTGSILANDTHLYTYTNDRTVAVPTKTRTGLSLILLTILSGLAILFMLYKRKKKQI